MRFRQLAREAAHDAGNLGVRLFVRDAVGELRDRDDVGARHVERRRGREAEWRPDVCGHERRRKPVGHHADHGVRLAIELHRASEYSGIAAEAALPGAVAQHDQRFLARFFVDREGPSEHRRLERERQQLRAHRCRGDNGGVGAGAEDAIGRRKTADAGERTAALAEPHDVDRVERIAVLRIRHPWRHQEQVDGAFAASQRDRAEERGVDGRKKSGVHADDERQRADGGGGVGRATDQPAVCLTKLEHALSIGGRWLMNLSHCVHQNDAARS
jgi:hypothetical protein